MVAGQFRVLVVDDEPHIADLLGSWFEGEGWSVTRASTGPEAVARFVASPPDAVVLDLDLPGYSGLEVLRRVRQVDPQAVVVICSARDDVYDVQAARAAGASDFVAKPFSPVELERRVRSLAVDCRPRQCHRPI